MIYGTDSGAYLTNNLPNIPFADLVKGGLCDFFVCKGAQDVANISTAVNLDAARAAGVPVIGCYYWHYASWDARQQIDYYSTAIRLEKPHWIALDMEDNQGLSSKVVSDNAHAVLQGLHTNFPKLPLYVYTSQNFINAKAPDCNTWLADYGIWIASWPDWGTPHTPSERMLSFEEIKACAFPNFNPYMPTAWKGKPWTFWQYGTWQELEGYGYPYYHQYDWSAYPGTLDNLKALCGLAVIPPVVPPTPAPELTLESLDVRLSKIEALPWYQQFFPVASKP